MFRRAVSRGLKIGMATGMLASSFSFTEGMSLDHQGQLKYDKNDFEIITGTANRDLSLKIAKELDVDLCDCETTRFSDGEILVKIDKTMRGKDVYIIQTCGTPVNDNVVELLLSIAAAKRSGATHVTAVVPYFGYNLNRRELPISNTHHSRFLGNTANDLAKMLQIVGVDKVISVDLQRPGQGHEACFFSTTIPAETISSESAFIEHFMKNVEFTNDVVVVSPNTENVKKVKKFHRKLSALLHNKGSKVAVDYAAFLRLDTDHSFVKGAYIELLGDVRGKDVILLEEYIENGNHMSALVNSMKKEGAKRVFVCATHGLFTEKAKQLIDLSPVEQVIITDTIALPAVHSKKIVQISIASLLARIIASDLSHSSHSEFTPDEDDYELDG